MVIERWLRVYGDSLRRIAEVEAAWWNSEVEMALLASGMTEGEMLQAQADLGSQMTPLIEQVLLAIYHAAGTRLEPGVRRARRARLEAAGLTAGWSVRRQCASWTSPGTRG